MPAGDDLSAGGVLVDGEREVAVEFETLSDLVLGVRGAQLHSVDRKAVLRQDIPVGEESNERTTLQSIDRPAALTNKPVLTRLEGLLAAFQKRLYVLLEFAVNLVDQIHQGRHPRPVCDTNEVAEFRGKYIVQ